jgi:thymidylate synthase (FAD)
MKIIKQYCTWEQKPPADTLQILERAGRTCYRSECLITPDSAIKFIKTIKDKNHQSVLEHVSASVRFITDRGVTHELVRHRLASFSQESTRYCNYSKEKFGDEITVIEPVWFYDVCPGSTNELNFHTWHECCEACEKAYFNLLKNGQTPQEARAVLPNSLKTEIVMTANLREWIHVFNLRTSKAAHPQMRNLAIECLNMFKDAVPVLFDDIKVD